MNTPVNFELAKLLKEKGFEQKIISFDYYLPNANKVDFKYVADNKNYRDYSFYAPTIAEVIMWLYEKHEIFIQPFTIGEEGKMKFYIKLIVNDNGWIKIKHQISTIYNSPTEAYEAAIEYTLNNLI